MNLSFLCQSIMMNKKEYLEDLLTIDEVIDIL